MDINISLFIIIVIFVIIICIVVKDDHTNTDKLVDHSLFPQKDKEITSSPLGIWDEVQQMDIPSAREWLTKKGNQANRIVPQFPLFPQLWLLPPSKKGTYSSLGERYCVEFMELLFSPHQFVKVKPPWLKNPRTGRRLELDGYCSELEIAIEYNGYQHYVWPNHLLKTEKEFLAQKYRDKIKVEMCKDRGVFLICIPYSIPISQIPLAIYSKLLEGMPNY